MFSLVFNFFAGAGVLAFLEAEQAKIRNRSVKRDSHFIGTAVAVAWLVNSGLLIRAILAW